MFTKHALRFLDAQKRAAAKGKVTVDAAGIARTAMGLGLAYGASTGGFAAGEALRKGDTDLARGIFCASTGVGGIIGAGTGMFLYSLIANPVFTAGVVSGASIGMAIESKLKNS